jgi:hypothetical protein
MREQTTVSFRGIVKTFSTAKEAYIWLIDKFCAAKPAILANFLISGHGGINRWARNYFARSRTQLFLASPHLAEDRNLYEPVSAGWLANVNMDNPRKFLVLRRLAALADFTYGSDWTWDAPDPPAIDLSLAIDL